MPMARAYMRSCASLRQNCATEKRYNEIRFLRYLDRECAMKRKLPALIVFCLVTLGAFVVLAAFAYASRAIYERGKIQQVDEFSRHAMTRAEIVIADSESALRELGRYAGTHCTPEHLRAMRRVEERHRYIRNVAWTDGKKIGCWALDGATGS